MGAQIVSDFPFTREVHERQVPVPDTFLDARGTGDREGNQAELGGDGSRLTHLVNNREVAPGRRAPRATRHVLRGRIDLRTIGRTGVVEFH